MAVMWSEIAKARGFTSVTAMFESMYPKFTIHQLSQRFGCSVDAVRRQLEKANIPIRARGGAITKPKLETLTAEDFKTKTAKEISLEHGVDITSVYKYMRRNGIEPPTVAKRRAALEEVERAKDVPEEELEETIDELLKRE